MKLLFIENRHKTYFFEPIANQLSEEGHSVHWIIQNKQFLPNGNSEKHIIAYPEKADLNGFQKKDYVEDVIKSDRQQNHFKKENTSYFYYYNKKIEEILKQVKPNLVFGESTAFHELLTIANCKLHGIIYLNPSTCRYPNGRFSFYKYDTLEPFGGSGEVLDEKSALETIEQIVGRKALPDYMKANNKGKRQQIIDKIKKSLGYYKGEKFNTPHPIIKYKLEKRKTQQIKFWDNLAQEKVVNDKNFKLLYPLQMQPEANIDVWGKKYRNQAKLIQKIAKSLPKDSVLYVKPNPKSKYELSDKLIDVVVSNKNIVPLAHKVKMDNVLPHVDLTITVTGTIAIECILSNKPVITLTKTINNESPNCIYIDSIENNLKSVIDMVKLGKFAIIDDNEKLEFINKLNSSSYRGIISDPFTDINCILPQNLDNVFEAFQQVLSKIKTH